MVYGKSWLNVTKDELMEEPNDYIRWYNGKRIKGHLERQVPWRVSVVLVWLHKQAQENIRPQK